MRTVELLPTAKCCPCCGSEDIYPSEISELAFIEHGEYKDERDSFDVEGECSAWNCRDCGTTFYVLL